MTHARPACSSGEAPDRTWSERRSSSFHFSETLPRARWGPENLLRSTLRPYTFSHLKHDFRTTEVSLPGNFFCTKPEVCLWSKGSSRPPKAGRGSRVDKSPHLETVNHSGESPDRAWSGCCALSLKIYLTDIFGNISLQVIQLFPLISAGQVSEFPDPFTFLAAVTTFGRFLRFEDAARNV